MYLRTLYVGLLVRERTVFSDERQYGIIQVCSVRKYRDFDDVFNTKKCFFDTCLNSLTVTSRWLFQNILPNAGEQLLYNFTYIMPSRKKWANQICVSTRLNCVAFEVIL